MNIAIVGYGKMGKQVENLLKDKNINYCTIDIFNPAAQFKKLNSQSLNDMDVAIDFSNPETIGDNIKQYLAAGVDVVMATTGWYGKLEEFKKLIGNKIGFIWSGNFSLGVNIFFRIVRNSAKLFDKFSQYDPAVIELHHKEKKDSPSGTSTMINQILLQELARKDKAVTERLDRKIAEDELHSASVRAGCIPGTHIVLFDSLVDTIELKHTARSREGFAEGAIAAAQWIVNKKGVYNIDDFIGSIIN